MNLMPANETPRTANQRTGESQPGLPKNTYVVRYLLDDGITTNVELIEGTSPETARREFVRKFPHVTLLQLS